MENTYISEQYQELLFGLNRLIDKTINIQKSQEGNSPLYRATLGFKLELEKTRLNIMQYHFQMNSIQN